MENQREELRKFEGEIKNREDALICAYNLLSHLYDNLHIRCRIEKAKEEKDWIFFADSLLALNARNEIIVNKLIGRANKVKRYKAMKND